MVKQHHLLCAVVVICQMLSIKGQASQAPQQQNSQDFLQRSAEVAISPTRKFSDSFRKAILEAAPERIKDLVAELKDAQYYQKSKIRKMLLYGPTGSGKRALVQAVAEETGRVFISVDPDLLNSETQDIQRIIDQAAQRPSILFIDKSDLVFKYGNSAKVAKFLDDIAHYPNIFLFGTTNSIKGMAQPIQDRFINEMKEVPHATSVEGKQRALSAHLNDCAHNCSPESLRQIAKQCSRLSNRGIEKVVDEARRIAMRRHPVSGMIIYEDIESALQKIKNDREAFKDDNKPSWVKKTFNVVGFYAEKMVYAAVSAYALKKLGLDGSAQTTGVVISRANSGMSGVDAAAMIENLRQNGGRAARPSEINALLARVQQR